MRRRWTVESGLDRRVLGPKQERSAQVLVGRGEHLARGSKGRIDARPISRLAVTGEGLGERLVDDREGRSHRLDLVRAEGDDTHGPRSFMRRSSCVVHTSRIVPPGAPDAPVRCGSVRTTPYHPGAGHVRECFL